MNDPSRRDIEQQCRDLVLRVTHHGDHREADEAAALFADDATWLRGGILYSGPAQIRSSYGRPSAAQVVRHIIGGTTVTVLNEDHATSVTYYLAIEGHADGPEPAYPLPLDPPLSMGEWHDSFVRTPGGWRFQSRATKRLFQRVEKP